MKLFAIASFLSSTVSALPTLNPVVEARQADSITRNDLQDGSSSSCPGVIFIYARGSTEAGNLGTLGPSIASRLESEYGSDGVWIQGVGGRYLTTITDNALPRGTSPAAIEEMIGLFELADSKCPDAILITGGYSQGAALTAASVEDLDSGIRDKIAGAVLFGYTRNFQNDGKIPNYSLEKTKVFCNEGDLVCQGTLIVLAPHLAYGPDASGPAPDFLIERVAAAGGA